MTVGTWSCQQGAVGGGGGKRGLIGGFFSFGILEATGWREPAGSAGRREGLRDGRAGCRGDRWSPKPIRKGLGTVAEDISGRAGRNQIW